MHTLQATQIQPAILPVAIVNNGAFTSKVIDTAGAGYLEFIAQLGVTDVAATVFKVMESDVKTDATTLGGTPDVVVDAAKKPGATDDNKTWVIGIDLKAPRKRYMQLQVTVGNSTGMFLAAIAILTGLDNISSNAADRNVADAEYV